MSSLREFHALALEEPTCGQCKNPAVPCAPAEGKEQLLVRCVGCGRSWVTGWRFVKMVSYER